MQNKKVKLKQQKTPNHRFLKYKSKLLLFRHKRQTILLTSYWKVAEHVIQIPALAGACESLRGSAGPGSTVWGALPFGSCPLVFCTIVWFSKLDFSDNRDGDWGICHSSQALYCGELQF